MTKQKRVFIKKKKKTTSEKGDETRSFRREL